MTPRRALIGALLLALIGVATWRWAISWRPDPAVYPRHGIDVSHHQGTQILTSRPADSNDAAIAIHVTVLADNVAAEIRAWRCVVAKRPAGQPSGHSWFPSGA